MRNWRLGIGILGVVAVCAVAPVTGVADEFIDFLKSLAQKWDAIETLHETAEWQVKAIAPDGGIITDTIPVEIFVRHGELLAQSGSCIFYMKGDDIFEHDDGTGEPYTAIPLGVDITPAELFMGLFGNTSADVMYLACSDEMKATLLDEDTGCEMPGFRVLPDEEYAGRLCQVVVLTDGGSSFLGLTPDMEKDWFDCDSGVVMGMEVIGRSAHSDPKEQHDIIVTYTVKTLAINEPVDESVFRKARKKSEKTWFEPESRVVLLEDEEIEGFEGEIESDGVASLNRFDLSGLEAPDFELPLLDGGTFKLSEARGKVVVIDFWATWCSPCIQALPDIKALAEQYADNPSVVVLGVSTDSKKNEKMVRSVVEKKGLAYPVGMDESEIEKAYCVSGIPCIVVVNQDGIIQGRSVGFSSGLQKDLQATIDVLLAGGALDSARPMTQEELEALGDVCENCGGRHGSSKTEPVVLDKTFFTERWSRDLPVASAAKAGRHSFVKMESAVLESGDLLPEEIPLPAPMRVRNIKGEMPKLYIVRHPDGDYLLAVRELYKKEKWRNEHEYFNIKSRYLMGMPLKGDHVGWIKQTKGVDGYRAFVWPVSDDEDLLVEVLQYANTLVLRDAKGSVVLSQRLPEIWQVVKIMNDGTPALLVLEAGKISRYDLVYPPPTAIDDETSEQPVEKE